MENYDNPFVRKSESQLQRLWTPRTVQVLSAAIFAAFPSLISPCLRALSAFTPTKEAGNLLAPTGDWLEAADGLFLRMFMLAVGCFFGLVVVRCLAILRSFIMRSMLGYIGWMYTPRAAKTKVWGLLLKLFRGPGPFTTYFFQPFMPRLPLPDLHSTIDKYLSVTKHLVSSDQYEITKQAAEEFRANEGPKAQAYLKERYSKMPNWFADYWVGGAYLSSRKPLPVNSNYYMTNAGFPGNSTDMVVRAAVNCNLLVMYRQALLDQQVPPTLMLDTVPLCMSGTRFIFNMTRLPGEYIDKIETYPGNDHLVVIRDGKFFMIDCYAKNKNGTRTPLSAEEFKIQFTRMLEMATEGPDGVDIGVLTSQDRPVWAKQRQVLMENTTNKETLQKVESALMVCTLEDYRPKDWHDLNKMALLGRTARERWYDKSFHHTFYGDGSIGCNIEHTVVDATVFGKMAEDINVEENYTYDHEQVVIDPSHPPRTLPDPIRLHWDMNGLEKMVNDAKEKWQKVRDDLDVYVLNAAYGKGIMKKCKVSPDGFLQMLIQLAYYRLHKETVRTYEPSTHRLFIFGRTETLHPVSEYSKKWVLAMDDPKADKKETISLLKQAIKIQSASRLDATAGAGCDRHMLGLYCACREMGMDVPTLFKDQAWQMDYKLSTSQTPNQMYERIANLHWDSSCGGFGPGCHDGYGISYIILGENNLNFQITSWKSCAETSSSKMAGALEKGMEDMKNLMLG